MYQVYQERWLKVDVGMVDLLGDRGAVEVWAVYVED